MPFLPGILLKRSLPAMGDKGFTVLLVEDDPADASRVTKAFSDLRMGHVLRCVASAQKAIDYLSGRGEYSDRDRFPFASLILISLSLSRRADFAMLRWIREQSAEIRRIPVVVLAAARQPPGFDRAYELGAVPYLVKPLDRNALKSLVKAVVEFWRLNGRQYDLAGGPPAVG